MTAIKRFKKLQEKLRLKYGKPKSIITVSGFSGVGSTTIAKLLADKLSWKQLSSGDFFRKKASEHKLPLEKFMAKIDRIGNEEEIDYDLLWDRHALEIAYKSKQLVLEGRLTGLLLYPASPVRILVRCKLQLAARRVAKREKRSYEQTLYELRKLWKANRKRYIKKYEVDPQAKKFYTLVVDNSGSLKNSVNKVVRHAKSRLDG